MERKLFAELIKWKDRAGHKPLLLLGARQVGKTWLMKEFGRRCFDNVAYVNCDAEPLAAHLFTEDYDIDRILFSVQTITGVKPEAGKTLIIFDEVQQVERGLHSLKYFAENAPQYHVVAAGSLLGITLGRGESFPVGKVDMLHVYPMDFGEFLFANAPQMYDVLRDGDWPLVETFASKLKEQLRQYYFVGGMPEVVADFVANHDQARVRQLQQNILNAYRNDISKHTTPTESMRIGQVLESLPSQLAKENKKFIYGAIKKGARAKEFELAIQWLVDAGIVCRVHRVKEIRMPVKFYEDLSAFKLFLKVSQNRFLSLWRNQRKHVPCENNVRHGQRVCVVDVMVLEHYNVFYFLCKGVFARDALLDIGRKPAGRFRVGNSEQGRVGYVEQVRLVRVNANL